MRETTWSNNSWERGVMLGTSLHLTLPLSPFFESSAQLSFHFSSAHYPSRVIDYSSLPSFPVILLSLCFSFLVCWKLATNVQRDIYSNIHDTNAQKRKKKLCLYAYYGKLHDKRYFGIRRHARQVCVQVPSVSETFLLIQVLLSYQPQFHKTTVPHLFLTTTS